MIEIRGVSYRSVHLDNDRNPRCTNRFAIPVRTGVLSLSRYGMVPDIEWYRPRLPVRGLPATGWYRQKIDRRRSISTIDDRLREKSTVGDRLREKKGRRRRRKEEEEKKNLLST
ncbi:hypothetical protein BHE74_00003050 [Ensete ventricosum]|nr:hypothetical protein BHE74_00003050 [Ensete ventricosum]RZS01048.1 hypothetical protein BHM03_00030837 [Ensete ventricosum]